jgi:predicted dehydrogenase
MTMSRATRRRFLAHSAAGVAVAATLRSRSVRAAAAGEKVRVGVIGCGNQGKSHILSLLSLADAQLAYICDIDSQRLAKWANEAPDARPVSDLRRILDDKSIDAVTIATPDHWHTPAALLALDAGKHVYVEKPCSHNVREGRALFDAARRQGKVVQHGTQSRSAPGIRRAIEMLHGGVIGKVLLARCWNWQRRVNIGHRRPSEPPVGVDYDTWVGPAPWLPYQENRFHYNWHWWHDFGCGGMGNDGIHELDYTLWGLGVDTHPNKVSAGGGKYYFDDDQQFPDTQQVSLEYEGDGTPGSRRMLVYEQRLWSTTYPFNVDAGAEFFGTEGRMFLSKRGKIEVLGDRNRPLELELPESVKVSVAENQQNWIDCIRSGEKPNADIELAHRTATAVHLGNIAVRVGRTLRFEPQREEILGDDEAAALLGRSYREGHWAVPHLV